MTDSIDFVFTYPYKQKFKIDKSGDLAGHLISPLVSSQQPGKLLSSLLKAITKQRQ